MASNYTEFYIQLVNCRTGQAIDDDTGRYCVLQAGVPLKQTIYSDSVGTALTNPPLMTNGVIQFWVAVATTTVDISILSASGQSYFLKGVTPSQHRRDVDPEKSEYTLVGAWAILSAHADAAVSAIAAPVNGGLPAGIRIKDVYIHKTSVGVGVGAGLVVDFGVSGDSDAFIDGATASSTGYDLITVDLTAASGSAAAGEIVMAAQRRGAKLVDFNAGFSVTETLGRSKGLFARKSYMISLVTTTNNLVFAITGTSALTTVAGSRGYVFYEYDIIPTAGN